MANSIWFISYKLKEGASEQEFLTASKKCNDEVLSKQKGFISWKVLKNGDTWVDLVTWETSEDAKNGEKAGAGNPAATEFYAFIDFKSLKHELFSVEESY